MQSKHEQQLWLDTVSSQRRHVSLQFDLVVQYLTPLMLLAYSCRMDIVLLFLPIQHIKAESKGRELVVTILGHVRRLVQKHLLVLGPLGADPATQGLVLLILGGDIGVPVFLKVLCQLLVFGIPRMLSFPLGPSEVYALQSIHTISRHACALIVVHKLLLHALFVHPLIKQGKE
jgi:hypothetical protein